MKTDHPIRINHARQNEPAAGAGRNSTRWRKGGCIFSPFPMT